MSAAWRLEMGVLNTQDSRHPPLMKRNRQENEFINILIAQVLAPVTLFFFPMHVKVIGRMNKNSLGLQKMFVKHLELISLNLILGAGTRVSEP